LHHFAEIIRILVLVLSALKPEAVSDCRYLPRLTADFLSGTLTRQAGFSMKFWQYFKKNPFKRLLVVAWSV